MLPLDEMESTSEQSLTTETMDSYITNMTSYNDTLGLQPPYWNIAEQVILCITLIMIMIVSLIGNALVIISVAYFKDMQRKTYVLIANLAVADFGVSLLAMPFSLATVINGDWTFGETLCNINGFLEALFLFASIHGLMHISIHKYFQLSRPLRRVIDKKWATIMICATWLVAFSAAMAPIVGLTTNEYKPGTTQCGPAFPTGVSTKIHAAYMILMGFFIPWTVLAFCYGFIYKNIREHGSRMTRNSSMSNRRVFQQQKRITLTLFIVFIVFFICWSPFIIFNIFGFIYGFDNIPIWPNALCYWMGYLNSAINPIIYGWRNRSFKRAFKEIVCCCRPTKPVFHGENGAVHRPTRGRASNRRRMLYPPITPSSPDYIPDRDRFRFLERTVSHISNPGSTIRRDFNGSPTRQRARFGNDPRWSTDLPQLPMVLEDPPSANNRTASPSRDTEVAERNGIVSSTSHDNPAFVLDDDPASVDGSFDIKRDEEKSIELSAMTSSENTQCVEKQAHPSKDAILNEANDQSPSEQQTGVSEIKVKFEDDDDKDRESGIGCSPSTSHENMKEESDIVSENIKEESDMVSENMKEESDIVSENLKEELSDIVSDDNVVPSLIRKSSYEQLEKQTDAGSKDALDLESSGRRKSSLSSIIAPIASNITKIAVPKPDDDDNETLL